jgi:DNA-binding CsgD family transcriptional regulator
MPRFSRAQELARQQIAHLADRGLSSQQLGKRLLAAIELAVGYDGAQLCGVDPTTLLFNRLVAVSAGMRPHTHWYLQNMYLNEPRPDFTHPSLMRTGLTAVAFHDRPETLWGLPKHLADQLSAPEFYRAYHEFTGAKGGILRAFFPAEDHWIAALDLARFDPGKPFRPTDVIFLRLVAPLIGRILRAAFDRERALGSANRADPEVWGVLVLASNGHVQSSTPAAENWLKALQEADAVLEHHLPTGVWSAIAGLRAGEQSASVSVLTPKGQLRIEASPVGVDGTVAVVLAPPWRPVPPAMPAHWHLTRQEQQVIEQVMRGLSNRQVAQTLVVTENTVESHLRHVYEKLNVHSRSQLLARYFAEIFNPDLF